MRIISDDGDAGPSFMEFGVCVSVVVVVMVARGGGRKKRKGVDDQVANEINQ